MTSTKEAAVVVKLALSARPFAILSLALLWTCCPGVSAAQVNVGKFKAELLYSGSLTNSVTTTGTGASITNQVGGIDLQPTPMPFDMSGIPNSPASTLSGGVTAHLPITI